MQTVTSEFLASLRISHSVALSCQLVLPPATSGPTVPILGGDVAADGTAQVRRTGRLETVAVAEVAPGVIPSDLPAGWYADLRRGIRYGDGRTELVRIGFLRVDSVAEDVVDGTLTLELSDRMQQVNDEQLLKPYAASGKTAANAIVELVQQVFGTSIGYDIDSRVPSTTLTDVTFDEDRGSAVAELAASINCAAYFDPAGDFVLRRNRWWLPQPPQTFAVWHVDAGATGVLVSMEDSYDRTATPNGILARGQQNARTSPVSYLARDLDPESPFLWGGPFGKVVEVVESTAVQSAADAQELAESILATRLGLARSLRLSSVPNPALEPGDIITLQQSETDEVEYLQVAALTVPLDATTGLDIQTATLPGTPGWPGPRAVPITRRARYGEAAWAELAAAEVPG